jgi:light-regulated signal transduction histidine kinase (bacteriophytochrome)
VRIVLDYSRTSRQRAPFEAVDTGNIVAQVRDDLDSQLQKAGARLDIGELPVVKGDPRLLRGLFENLIDNSLKYHSDAPIEISVTAVRRGDTWVFTIEDNGVGISEEDSDEVFLMFARGSRTQDIPGVGIGLALCRKIVEYHAGRIWIDSSDEGGTKLVFTLPAD